MAQASELSFLSCLSHREMRSSLRESHTHSVTWGDPKVTRFFLKSYISLNISPPKKNSRYFWVPPRKFFLQFFLHSYTAQFNLECMGPFKLLSSSGHTLKRVREGSSTQPAEYLD